MTHTPPTAHLVCGRLCSGKSTYAQSLCKSEGAVLLSCDELVLTILGSDLGDRHDEILAKVKDYLFKKADELLSCGTGVVLEWGFWSRADRDFAREFFAQRGHRTALHYITLSDEQWQANIDRRNELVRQGQSQSYLVDDGLLRKATELFEPPAPDEADVVYCVDEHLI